MLELCQQEVLCYSGMLISVPPLQGPLELERSLRVNSVYSSQVPRLGEVVIDVQTTQAPVGIGQPLDLPDAEGLTLEQHHQFPETIHHWPGVFTAHEEDFGKTDAILYKIPLETLPRVAKGIPLYLLVSNQSCSPCSRAC
ncbi:hypothetical protein SKAU_G00231710 [Synaphobranchus kaupii]|uniref:Uncharacterized protein n=1 Tax=Synaphobranchus kaupii TaxID=118154 RepID=A0A9Q1F5W3_SYNKA|nr:hypothetical protein SKAU_G00231710 [Synaphobranchus kaupii]